MLRLLRTQPTLLSVSRAVFPPICARALPDFRHLRRALPIPANPSALAATIVQPGSERLPMCSSSKADRRSTQSRSLLRGETTPCEERCRSVGYFLEESHAQRVPE